MHILRYGALYIQSSRSPGNCCTIWASRACLHDLTTSWTRKHSVTPAFLWGSPIRQAQEDPCYRASDQHKCKDQTGPHGLPQLSSARRRIERAFETKIVWAHVAANSSG